MAAIKLTAGETKLLPLAWQCFEAPPKVNLNKLAELGNYKNAASANTCWYNLKSKLLQQNGSKPSDTTSITPAEQKLLTLVWQCFDSVPKVNNKKLAELGNYKNPASANTCWYNLKKKFLSADGSTQISPKKRAADGSAGGEGATPKKRRGRKTKSAIEENGSGAKVGTTVEGADDSDDDLEVVTPKREQVTDTRALKLEILREMEAEDEAYQKSKQRGGKVKAETTAEEEEVSKAFFEQVAAYSSDT